VLANPPFNVDDVALSAVEKDKRFNTFGLPRNKTKAKKSEQGKETVPNANYLWINLFATSLKDTGRAALVMANSASDARHGEADCRRTLIENNLIYGMFTLPSNMFYTVTLPATLWFFDKTKTDTGILFIDARNIFTQIDRAHRELTEEQIQNIAIISRLHKGRRGEFVSLIDRYFAQGLERLVENRQQVEPVAAQLLAVLAGQVGKVAVASLVTAWDGLDALQQAYAAYQQHNAAWPRRKTKTSPSGHCALPSTPSSAPCTTVSNSPTAPSATRRNRLPSKPRPTASGAAPTAKPRHSRPRLRPSMPRSGAPKAGSHTSIGCRGLDHNSAHPRHAATSVSVGRLTGRGRRRAGGGRSTCASTWSNSTG